MTTVVVESFSLENFYTLRDPKVTLKDLKPKWMDVVSKLHQVFLKYQMDDYFVLALVHRHHDLFENELLIEVVENGVSTTSATIPDPEDHISPHIWRILDGKLYPFEFLNLSKSDSINKSVFCVNYLRLLNSKDFIDEVSDILVATGTENILGIQTAHRYDFKRPGEMLSEDSNEHRQSVVKSLPIQTAPACSVPVSWQMGPAMTFCENCIPDWEVCDETAGLEVPKKLECLASGCFCSTCRWEGGGHVKSSRC